MVVAGIHTLLRIQRLDSRYKHTGMTFKKTGLKRGENFKTRTFCKPKGLDSAKLPGGLPSAVGG
jgi:hypothetical protein